MPGAPSRPRPKDSQGLPERRQARLSGRQHTCSGRPTPRGSAQQGLWPMPCLGQQSTGLPPSSRPAAQGSAQNKQRLRVAEHCLPLDMVGDWSRFTQPLSDRLLCRACSSCLVASRAAKLASCCATVGPRASGATQPSCTAAWSRSSRTARCRLVSCPCIPSGQAAPVAACTLGSATVWSAETTVAAAATSARRRRGQAAADPLALACRV